MIRMESAKRQKVFIHGLEYRADLNGRECTLLDGHAQPERLRLLCDGQILNVKESNVEDGDSHRARLAKAAARLSDAAVDCALEDLVCSLLRAAVDANAQDVELQAALVEKRRAQEAEERETERIEREQHWTQWLLEQEQHRSEEEQRDRKRAYEMVEFGTQREVYEEWLEMMREHRRDPSYYDRLLGAGADDSEFDPEDPNGGADEHFVPWRFDPGDPQGGTDQDGAPWGLHPFYDYGYERCLGKGRVLWDLLRPSVRRVGSRAVDKKRYWECVEEAAKALERVRIARARRGLVDDPL